MAYGRAHFRGNRAIAHAAFRGPGVPDAAHYHRRVTWLAVVHPALFVAALAGIALLVWRGRLFVTLAQRSNVETLTIAFFLLFFGYFAVVTAPGAIGAAHLAWFRFRARVSRDGERIATQRMAALGEPGRGPSAAFDMVIELASAPGTAWEVEIRDEVGSLGHLRFDGVRVIHDGALRGGSNTLLGYVEDKLRELTATDVTIEITLEVTLRAPGGRSLRESKTIDMEAHEQLSLTIDIAAPPDDYTATTAAKYPD